MKKIFILSSALVIFLVSCGSNTIFMDTLIGIKKGMSPKQADSLLDVDKLHSYSFEIDGIKYQADSYSMQVFYEQTQSTSTQNFGNMAITTTTTRTTTLETSYYLIFKENTLYYWGFLYEETRADNPVLINAAKKIKSLSGNES